MAVFAFFPQGFVSHKPVSDFSLFLMAFGTGNTGMLPCQRKSSLGVMIERKQMPSFCSMTAIAGRFPLHGKLPAMGFFVAAFTYRGGVEKITMFIGRTGGNHEVTFPAFQLRMLSPQRKFCLVMGEQQLVPRFRSVTGFAAMRHLGRKLSRMNIAVTGLAVDCTLPTVFVACRMTFYARKRCMSPLQWQSRGRMILQRKMSRTESRNRMTRFAFAAGFSFH